MTDAAPNPTFTDRALADGHLRLDTSGKTEKIVYVAANHAERWSDPEEKVRAEFYTELIYRYQYAPARPASIPMTVG
jgi:type I restriction enzyme M protein